MKNVILLVITFTVLSLCGFAQQIISHPTEVKNPVYHDVSPPLREMKILPPESEPRRWENGEVPNNTIPDNWNEDNQNYARSNLKDPVIQDKMGELAPISTIANFKGIKGTGYAPPDPTGAVGLNYYIQAVNVAFAIYSKTGDSVYGPAGLGTLWQGFPGYHGSDGDPIILFDHLANRWLVSQFSLPNYPNGPFYEVIAISQTEDPLGSWYRYSFQFSAMPDYPKFGVWPDGYYMSANSFSSGTTNWLGPNLIVLERDSMLVGGLARMVFFQQASFLEHMLPAALDGPPPPTGTPGYFVSAKNNSGTNNDLIQLYELQVDWDSVAISNFSGPLSIPIAGYSTICQGSGCIPQKNTSKKLDGLGKSMMNRLQYRNFGSYKSLLVNHSVTADGTNRAGVRWYELRDYNGQWSVYQQSTYSPDTLYRWMGSVTMDVNGNVALGYSVSGAAIFPSIGVTGRRFDDPPGQMTCNEEMIIQGTGSQTGTDRWGDYSSMCLDPADDATFWYTNMYYETTSSMTWSTRIASFTINNLHVDARKLSPDESKNNHLLNAYPNPLAGKTKLRWRLTEASQVQISILDTRGKILETLVNEFKQPGEYSFDFESSGLANGVYFCRFKAGKIIENQKLVLIK